jgi:hypothetical protein
VAIVPETSTKEERETKTPPGGDREEFGVNKSPETE